MEPIVLDLSRFASLVEKATDYIFTQDCLVAELVEKALALDKEEELSVKSKATSLKMAYAEYQRAGEDSPEEKAVIRKAISLCKNMEELIDVHGEIMGGILPDSYEGMCFIRKMSEFV